MAMQYQLRIYTVRPGEMEDWLREWKEKIVPLRKKLGFQVLGAWTMREADRFIWLLGYAADRTFEEADAAYYQSADRKAVQPDPARHLAKTEKWRMQAVPVE